jgi:hypothetical protein
LTFTSSLFHFIAVIVTFSSTTMAPADVLSTMPAKLSLTWGHAVAGLILVAILRALYYRVRAMRSPLNKLPGAPPYSMIFGDFPKVAGQPTGTIAQMNTKLFGHTYRTSNGIFSLPGVVTSDLAALGYIQRNSDMFIKPPVQARMLKNLAGNGVLMAEHDVHRRQRRILNPAFSPAAIREMIPIFYAKAYELRDRIAATIEEDTQHNASPTPPKPEDIIPGSRKLDMGKYLTEYAFDVIGMAGFDYDFGCKLARHASPMILTLPRSPYPQPRRAGLP